MEQKRASLEIIAPTVEEAVERGLADLGLSEPEVEVEILDSGSKGLFGLGFRQARIRLTIKSDEGKETLQQQPPSLSEPAEAVPAAGSAAISKPAASKPAVSKPKAEKPMPQPVAMKTSAPDHEQADLVEGEIELEPLEKSEEDLDEHLLDVASETVQELLDKMKIKAHLTASFGEPDDPNDRAPLMVDIRGDDLSILIGPRAETLNALQYIAALIIGKEIGHSVPLVIDVEGFRARRSQQIRQLARRMAEQAVRTGRRQVLEPMPSSERRLIHIELREHPDVTTESIGEEPRRKVTIIPK